MLKALMEAAAKPKVITHKYLQGIYIDDVRGKPALISSDGTILVACFEESANIAKNEILDEYGIEYGKDYNIGDILYLNKKNIQDKRLVETDSTYANWKMSIPKIYSNPCEALLVFDFKILKRADVCWRDIANANFIYPQMWNGPGSPTASIFNNNVLMVVMPLNADKMRNYFEVDVSNDISYLF